MQPTMKLRWKRSKGNYKTDPAIEDGYGDKLVLQQWWEEVTFVGQQHIPTGNGQWRDIPLEED